MKCPTCVEEGKTSAVYPGMAMSTLAYYQPFYDEDGKYHYHDSNSVSIDMRCSEGHTWQHENIKTCWCGWNSQR